MNKKVIYLLIGMLFGAIFSCHKYGSQFRMPERIAVLPTINQTTDLLAGMVFRQMFYIELEDKYAANLLSIELVDTLLNEEGITQGGQLAAVDSSELYQILQADGLLYIELLACDYRTLGVSETRRVKVHFRLIRPPNEKLWDFEYEVDEGKSVFDTFMTLLADPKEAFKDSAEDLGKQLGQKAGRMWLLNHPLKPEMEAVIEAALDDLP